eukprot:TRINITY_DN57963_c0_g1_i2.p1 TRINITY_DN57963_c0_g1~~TRINITY_DN57963_c0_g1_i2.p1  ORF type:complete len:396 (-),score=31.54 TRINITY_DN57963_c0_g1_i2:32-1219(-)
MGADLPELRLRRQAMGKEASFSATDSSDGLTSTDDEDAFASWQQFEIKLLLWIQSCRPWLTPPALFVHHLVSLEVVSPVLAGMVWLTSLPEAASTIACICVSQAVNTTIKWCFQRPRPLWFLPLSSGVVNMEGTWQGDYSFPSSHGQFFAGFVFCAAGVYQILLRWYPALVFLVVLSGLTRNYLGLHWCSDTLVGGCLGSLIGLVWGAHDPIPWLMNTSDGVLSAIIATFVIVCLVSMLQLARGLVPSVDECRFGEWHLNAVASLPEDLREKAEREPEDYVIKRRVFESIAPELMTAWCAMLASSFWRLLLPSSALQPCLTGETTILTLFLRLLLGLSGLVLLALPMLILRKRLPSSASKLGLKAFTFLALCSWVFVVSHVVLERLGLTCSSAAS